MGATTSEMGYLYTFSLLLIVAFIFVRGGVEERAVIATMLITSIGTMAVVWSQGQSFNRFSPLLTANEAVLLVVTLSVAYRSNRFWPLAVASLELAAFLSLLAPLFGRNLVSYGMGVAQGLWAYPQLIILVLAVIRGRNRGKRTSSPSS